MSSDAQNTNASTSGRPTNRSRPPRLHGAPSTQPPLHLSYQRGRYRPPAQPELPSQTLRPANRTTRQLPGEQHEQLREQLEQEKAKVQALTVEMGHLKGERDRLLNEVEWLRATTSQRISMEEEGFDEERKKTRVGDDADREGGGATLHKVLEDLAHTVSKLVVSHENSVRQKDEQGKQFGTDKKMFLEILKGIDQTLPNERESTSHSPRPLFSDAAKFTVDKATDLCISFRANLSAARASAKIDGASAVTAAAESTAAPLAMAATSIASLGPSGTLGGTVLAAALAILLSNFLWGGGQLEVITEVEKGEGEAEEEEVRTQSVGSEEEEIGRGDRKEHKKEACATASRDPEEE